MGRSIRVLAVILFIRRWLCLWEPAASGGPCVVHGASRLSCRSGLMMRNPGFAPQPQTCTLEAVL